MSSSITTEAYGKSPAKKRRFLTAEKKFQIYLEAQASDQPGCPRSRGDRCGRRRESGGKAAV
jgi:hypothetical protein